MTGMPSDAGERTADQPLAIKRGVPLAERPRLLGAMLDASARRFPDRVAVDFLGGTTSWGALAKAVDRAAAGLQALGVVKGTRVALCLPNTPYYPVLFYATLKAGGIVVNVNPLYVERELAHLIHDSGAEIIVTCDLAEIQARVLKVSRETGIRHVVSCPIADALPTIKSSRTRSSSARRSAARRVTRCTFITPI